MLEMTFSIVSWFGDKEKKRLKERKSWKNKRREKKPTWSTEEEEEEAIAKKDDRSKRTKRRTTIYKHRLKHSVKAFNTKCWKLASKGQSQFTNYK
jgi:hypothetical protein